MEGAIGEIRMFGGNFNPRTWAYCEGQILAINTHQSLYSILGTTYGGDGRTSFALPDLRGRAAIGAGHGAGLSERRLGAKVGSETNTLTVNEMPAHNHLASGSVKPGASAGRGTLSNDPTGRYPAQTQVGNDIYSDTPNTLMGRNDVTVTLNNTGGNQSYNNMMPYIAIHYIICLAGIFPSRN